jgi:hypothetical protein
MSKNGNFLTLAVLVLLTAVSVRAEQKKDEKPGGFGMGPGIVLLESIRPSNGEVDVATATNFTFEVYNDTPEKHTFTITVRNARSTLSSWEMGYENLPDTSWLRLDQPELEIEPGAKGKVKLFVKIPDKLENYNRKWMAVVACSPGKAKAGGSSVGLMVASRVQIETVQRDEGTGENAGRIGVTPCAWMMSDVRPGDSWRKTFKIANNTDAEHTYTVKRIGELEKDETKHDRYFGQGFTKVAAESWAKPRETTFTLQPRKVYELTIGVQVPKNVTPAKSYEELVFLQDETGHVDFLRLRSEVIATTADAQTNDQKAP